MVRMEPELFRNCKSNNRESLSPRLLGPPLQSLALEYVYMCISGYIAEHEQNIRYM